MPSTRVLVTGAGGFIGSHLAERLVEEGHQVRAFLHYNSRTDLGWLEQSSRLREIEVVRGDVRDFDSVLGAVRGCETVFHLAALIGIPYSYVSPLAYIRTNIEGTYNVLQACRATDCGNVVVTSTSETYGTAQYVPIDEKHPAVGQSPYSATKIGADQLAISFHRSYGMPVKILRPFNTFGPRQSARAIIPTIVAQILSGSQEVKVGNVTPTRDLTYVADIVQAFLAVAKTEACVGEALNAGSGKEIAIRDLVLLIGRLMRVGVTIARDQERVRPENSEVERLLCDSTKLRRLTGWAPQHSLESGLQAVIDWLPQHLDRYKADWYNV
jgi:dTDP-glucose 4,6-dehydratase